MLDKVSVPKTMANVNIDDVQDFIAFLLAVGITSPGSRVPILSSIRVHPSTELPPPGFNLQLGPRISKPVLHALAAFFFYKMFTYYKVGEFATDLNIRRAGSYVGISADKSEDEVQERRRKLAAKIAEARRVSADRRRSGLTGRHPIGTRKPKQ